jgi:AAA15 family ATPase/GTPase
MGELGSLHLKLYGLGSDEFKSRAATNGTLSQDRRLTLLSKLLESGEREEQLITMLRALDERVDAVRILSQHGHSYVAIGFNKKQRIPVNHAGQGMERMIGIFSEILGEAADIICIDEIENGLHYTALKSIWNGIAEIATRLGVQLFITTHSRECLEAAHRVFEERQSYDLRVVQLYRVRDQIDGRVLDREHITAAVESEIEVRG